MNILDKVLVKEIITPIVTIVLAFLLSMFTKKVTKKIFQKDNKKIHDKKHKTVIGLINSIIRFFIWAIALLVILDVFGFDTKSLLASLGIIGLVIGLALQDVLKDLVAGISIIFDNQYAIGDIIEINNFKGEVIELSLRLTKIKSYTGEVKMISNRNITEVINYSKAINLSLIDIPVSYDSNIEKVKIVLDNLCFELRKKYSLKDVVCVGVQELADSAIVFRITASSKKMDKYEVERLIRKEVVLELEKNNIEIPYQQVVIHNAK